MVVMGRVAGAFGIKGWVRIQPFTQTVDGLLDYPTWWVGKDASWTEMPVEDATAHGRSVIAKLHGIEEREAAANLRDFQIAVPRSELPPKADGEFYWTELIGLEVRNLEGDGLGKVTQLLETGAQQVLVVFGERERLIPFIAPILVSVDLAGGSLVVDWGTDF